MATWATLRNMDLDEVATTQRMYQILAFFDKHLVDTAGWTRIATGGGSAQATTWGSATELALYPSVTVPNLMAADCWGVWENADGVQLCAKAESSSQFELWVSPGGNFVVTSTTATVPPSETGTAPADMITLPSSSWAGAYPSKITMAYSSDNNSIIIFGRRGSGTIYDEIAFIFTKLENVKAADTIANGEFPYWAYSYAAQSQNVWDTNHLSGGQTTAGWSTHPTNGVKQYYVFEPNVDGQIPFDSIPVDPISGNSQRMEEILMCGEAGSIHIRGTVPGLFRVSDAVHQSGDRLDDAGGGVYDWIVIGNYAVPWLSSDNMLW
jgi:hypothetical protein